MRTLFLVAAIVASGAAWANTPTQCALNDICLTVDSPLGAEVPLVTGTNPAIQIFPNGAITIRSKDSDIAYCNTAGTDPAITSFTAAPTPLAPGAQVTLTWASINMPAGTPCQASGGPTEWTALGNLPASGNRQITAAGAAGATLTYTLTCTAGQVVRTRTASVVLSGGGGGGNNCTGQNAPPAGYVLRNRGDLGATFPYGIGGQFPPQQNQRFYSLSVGESTSWSFVAQQGGAPTGGVSVDEWIGTGQVFGSGTISISRCPHDYGANLNTTTPSVVCKSGPSGVHSLSFAFSPSPGSCPLTVGQAYYYNMTTGNGDGLGFCTGMTCSPLIVWLGASRFFWWQQL